MDAEALVTVIMTITVTAVREKFRRLHHTPEVGEAFSCERVMTTEDLVRRLERGGAEGEATKRFRVGDYLFEVDDAAAEELPRWICREGDRFDAKEEAAEFLRIIRPEWSKDLIAAVAEKAADRLEEKIT